MTASGCAHSRACSPATARTVFRFVPPPLPILRQEYVVGPMPPSDTVALGKVTLLTTPGGAEAASAVIADSISDTLR